MKHNDKSGRAGDNKPQEQFGKRCPSNERFIDKLRKLDFMAHVEYSMILLCQDIILPLN